MWGKEMGKWLADGHHRYHIVYMEGRSIHIGTASVCLIYAILSEGSTTINHDI